MHVSRRKGVVFGRLQQHVGVLVVSQLMNALSDEKGRPHLLVKGGTSLELRRGIALSRASRDLDAVTRQDLELVWQALAAAAAQGWEGFTGVLTEPESIDVPGLIVKPCRFMVKLKYQGAPFVSVPVEVSPQEAGNTDEVDWTHSPALELVDLQILKALMTGEPLAPVRHACVEVFGSRAQQTWPPTVTVYDHWPRIYAGALSSVPDLDLASNVQEAALVVNDFIRRVDGQ